MTPTSNQTPSPRSDKHDARIALFLITAASYLAANFVLRWMNQQLLNSYGAYGWPAPTTFDLALMAFLLTSPALLFGCLGGLPIRKLRPHRFALVTGIALFSIATIVIEQIYGWYSMSKTLPTWDHVYQFVTEDWGDHFGITQAMVNTSILTAAIHTAVITVIAVTAAYFPGRLLPGTIKTPAVVLPLALIFGLNIAGVSYFNRAGSEQWSELARQSIFHPHTLEQEWLGNPREKERLRAANELAAQVRRETQASRPTRQNSGTVSGNRNVLILAIEGWSPGFVNAETMPFYTRWADQHAVISEHHYSSGNNTLNGILGLLHGSAPVSFYQVDAPGVQSEFVQTFADRHYETRRLTTDLTTYRQIDRYIRNFTRDAVDTEDDWNLLDPIAEELSPSDSRFVFAYYSGTHFPYVHRDDFTAFSPEVPADFNYSSPSVASHKQGIRNRYRNCLRELDSWLEHLFQRVDWRNTVLVITGDHGEAFFEKGRLSHSSTLEREMIHTPLAVYHPGIRPGKIQGVTSHLDIMPTLFDVLGWPVPDSAQGMSLFNPERTSGALVVFQNKPYQARRWAAVTDGRKSIWQLADGDDAPEVIDLVDTDDAPLAAEAGWLDNFRFQFSTLDSEARGRWDG